MRIQRNPDGSIEYFPNEQDDGTTIPLPLVGHMHFHYTVNRAQKYPAITDQLDMLYHDINNGVFGENAKQSQWFKSINAIKTEFPKE